MSVVGVEVPVVGSHFLFFPVFVEWNCILHPNSCSGGSGGSGVSSVKRSAMT